MYPTLWFGYQNDRLEQAYTEKQSPDTPHPPGLQATPCRTVPAYTRTVRRRKRACGARAAAALAPASFVIKKTGIKRNPL